MTAHEMVAKVRNLPSISTAALKLVSLLDRPDISNEDVVQVLKYDAVLTAKLLRACNSPAFGLAEPVVSVDQAVLLLGHKQVLQMVMALALGGPMTLALPGYSLEANQLWRHSLLAANAAQIAATDGLVPGAPGPAAFTAGLLHDLGKLVVSHFLTAETLSAIHQRIAEGQSGVQAEKSVLETDHAEVGACLLYLWRVPEEITEAVANHHQPVRELPLRLSVVAHFANGVAHLAGPAISGEADALNNDPQAVEALSLSAEKLEDLLIRVREASDRIDQFMETA